jgi:hypothetical protein
MSYKSHYTSGDWKADCDVCGKTFKASSLRKRWDGLMVCSKDYESRHPQEFVRGSIDTQVPSWTRPEPTDTFVSIGGYMADSTYFIELYVVMEPT